MQLSIVIPTFNSELIIDKLVKQIENEKFYSYEIVIVNDCSTDETYKKLIALKKIFQILKLLTYSQILVKLERLFVELKKLQVR